MSNSDYSGREELVTKAKEMAEAHWVWVEKICHMMYVDAMVHGYVHGVESVEETRKRSQGGTE